MSLSRQIRQDRLNARTSERENSLSQQELTSQQSTPDQTVLKQGVRLLTGILILLLIAFCFFASSVCITIVVAAFLSILVDPAVTALERIRIPRFFAAALIVLLEFSLWLVGLRFVRQIDGFF